MSTEQDKQQQSQQPVGNQPQQPYGNQPQQPYGGQPQQPYGNQPQQPYGNQPQQPYGGQPQQPYGYQQQPQQPYGYQQQPQQPYGYQQQPQQPYGYQQQPQQPYGYQQQPYGYQQPQQPVGMVMQASPAEKDAFFRSAASVFMLIFCIISTVNLLSSVIGDIVTLNISGLLTIVLDILIVIGLWLTWGAALKKNMKTTGLSMIKVPYTIQFVFTTIGFAFTLIFSCITLNFVSAIVGLLTYIFQAICFNSVKKTLVAAITINKDQSALGQKAGAFAAIMMIISASLTFISTVISYVTLQALSAALEELGLPEFITSMLTGGGVATVVIGAIALLAQISGAIVMLQFGKRLKAAHEGR